MIQASFNVETVTASTAVKAMARTGLIEGRGTNYVNKNSTSAIFWGQNASMDGLMAGVSSEDFSSLNYVRITANSRV